MILLPFRSQISNIRLCLRFGLCSIVKMMELFHLCHGSVRFRRKQRISAWLDCVAWQRWDTNCVGQRRIYCEMEFTNCGLDFRGCTIEWLYFFHSSLAVVVSHGLVKERAVPPIEIERAIQ